MCFKTVLMPVGALFLKNFLLCLCGKLVCVSNADLYWRFYGPYEGSCFLEENKRQRWRGEKRRGLY